MADATYAIPGFLGGEISEAAQGRFDKPDYRVSLNVCLNAFPGEMGAWTRRPGTKYAGHTRLGAMARTVKFDFQQSAPITLEFSDGKLRFRSGVTLVTTNDAQTVVAISSADPAVVEVASAVDWATGDTVILPGASTAPLENRQFTITSLDSTHFSLQDSLSGADIDGAALGPLASGATVARVHELTTRYVGNLWSSVRAVQAETTNVLLCDSVAPQILDVTTLPSADVNPVFEIAAAVFQDGPYLDPFTNGVQVTPASLSGIVTLTMSFPTYDAAAAYQQGSFVTASGVNYVSLIDQNVNNTPASSPSAWATTSAGAAINDGQGFLGSDVGRLVRLLSEPQAWNVATAYSAGNVVSYNPTGQPGAATYWSAMTSTTGHIPGTDLVHWQIVSQGAALWTWGRITSLANVIDRALSGSAQIGNMTLNGGLNAAFDGVFSKSSGLSADLGVSSGGTFSAGTLITLYAYVGKNYSGASAQKISQATIYPSTDIGFGNGNYAAGGSSIQFGLNFLLNLRAKQTAPSSSSDGTLLGTSNGFGNQTRAVTIISNDTTTAWNYVWIELVTFAQINEFSTFYSFSSVISQVSFFSPTTATAGAACNVEILGPALLYTHPILTWRLGVYSDTTGWPTCGTYHEGRLWLGGAVPNRFDASVSNGIDGNRINFAPTNQYGVVAASNALSYTLNSDGVNPMFWMKPDLSGVVIGTQQGEWLVQAPTTGPIAPTNIAARRMTKNGSENIEPVRAPNANLFVKRHGRKLMEYFADAYSGKFSAPNLADKAGHIVRAGIAELAYTDGQTPVVWGRDADNSLFGMTYRRTVISAQQGPDFYAWHRHELGSGRTVESICGGPSVDGDLDSLTMVTTESEIGVRHVEVMTDAFDEDADLADAWFLDDAVEPTSTSTDITPAPGAPYGGITLNGLWHLNDKTVQVFADGVDCGDRGTGSTGYTDFLVTDGSCFVPFGDGISAGPGRGLFTKDFANAARIVVGFTYDSDGQTVRPIAPQDSGARNGPALGKTRRNHQYSVLVSNTVGVSFGATFGTLRPALFRKANGNPIDALTTYSGVHHDTLSDDYSYDGMIAWRISRPWPANIIAISGNVQTQDR